MMTDNNIRRLPRDEGAELAVIASMLFDNEALLVAKDMLSDKDFYRNDYRLVFGALLHLESNDIPVDLITLRNLLEEKGYLDKIGGTEALANIASSVSTSANIRHYADIVAGKSMRRQVIAYAENMSKAGLDDGQSISDYEAVVTGEKSLRDATERIIKSQRVLWDFIDGIGKPKDRIMTGFERMDKFIGGLRVPSVAMVGAYPSVGKTAFALNVVSNQDGPVALFSLEMSAEMIYERLISSIGKVDYGAFSAQKFDDRQRAEIQRSSEILKKKALYLFDDIYDIEKQHEIVAKIKPRLVVVDYLQKVRTAQKTDGRRHEIDYISGEYKRMANLNNCVIMLLSQISRVDRGQPTMASLKESGALEADGDYVGLLHRPYVLKKDNPDISPTEAFFLLDKNKFGRTGKVDLHFEGRYQRFYEVENPRYFEYFAREKVTEPPPFD